MPDFIHEDFLLESAAAKRLYHDYAAKMPIIDYHNHLSPVIIANNHNFINITEAWIDVARSTAETYHRVFLMRLILTAGDEISVFVRFEIRQPECADHHACAKVADHSRQHQQ